MQVQRVLCPSELLLLVVGVGESTTVGSLCVQKNTIIKPLEEEFIITAIAIQNQE